MSMEREYKIIWQPEPESGFSVFMPELPSVATQGKTIEEATEMAKEATEGYLEVMHGDGLRSRPSTAAASLSTRRGARLPAVSGKYVRRPRKGGLVRQTQLRSSSSPISALFSWRLNAA